MMGDKEILRAAFGWALSAIGVMLRLQAVKA